MKPASVDLGGGDHIYIYIYICTHTQKPGHCGSAFFSEVSATCESKIADN